jgi:hypothetical protein
MAEIYKNATITIAAASSADVKFGFLEDRLFPKIPLPLALPEGGLGPLWIHEGFRTPPNEPLDRRGWTLQEALLSPRILYYGSKDLIWRCQHEPFKSVFPAHNLYVDTRAPIESSNLLNRIPHFKLSNLYRIVKLNSIEYSTIRYDFHNVTLRDLGI